MNAYRLEDGRLLIPVRAEGDDGLIGDGLELIGPDDPRYAEWEPHAIPEPSEKGDAP